MNLAAQRLAALQTTPAVPARPRLHPLATRARQRREQHMARNARPDAAQLAAVLDAVSRRCASGESLATALGAASALSPDAGANPLAVAGTVISRGGTVVEALDAVRSNNHPDVTLAVHVLTLCATQGGNVSESLDRAAATLRERHSIGQERIAHSAQARLSARVLTVVPVAFASWTLLTTPTVRSFVGTPAGVVCFGLGIAANITGWRLMRRAIRRSE